MPRVVKKPEAENDLVDLFVYIGRNNIRAADRFLEAADKAMRRLAAMPEMGSVCESDKLALTGLRIWSIRGFKKYVILYRPIEDGVEVVRVLHGARQWPEKL